MGDGFVLENPRVWYVENLRRSLLYTFHKPLGDVAEAVNRRISKRPRMMGFDHRWITSVHFALHRNSSTHHGNSTQHKTFFFSFSCVIE